MCVLGFVGLGFLVLAGMGPIQPGRAVAPKSNQDVGVRLNPSRFRCIVVGDSQTTDPSAFRIRTQTHGWDAPIIGELICVGNSATGFLVNNSNAGQSDIVYQSIEMNQGWPNGGPADFFALFGANWTFLGDINAPGSRIGRYRLRFGISNTDAPWEEPWGVGQPLVAKIAVRTSPMCVDAIETRAERGGISSPGARTVHKLSKQWGIQIIEQPIPIDFNPLGDDVGVGFYLPSSSVEQFGQFLQVLGVVIERVGPKGQRLNGTLIGYQGRGGWSAQEHLDRISPASRSALIEMIDAQYIMMMLGHNQEPGGQASIEPDLLRLVSEWEKAFTVIGRSRPSFVFVVPWAVISESASPYMLEVESVMQMLAADNRRDMLVNYLQRYMYLRPDVYDSAQFELDNALVHPGDIPTAVNLSEDLFEMLFHPDRTPDQ